jgi:SAM-dependent methyltransferase
MSRVHRAAEHFGDVAEAYERARPSYPPEAVAFLGERLALRAGAHVADVGAGTGKLTRLLMPSGARVSAVEPVAGMRAQLARELPDVAAIDGTAESMPFDDGALDAVTAAQAVHWFGEGAARELARALRSGGMIGIVYNRRDATQRVHRTISAARQRVAEGAPSYASGEWRTRFERCDQLVDEGLHAFPWSFELPHVAVLDQVGTLAPIAALDDAARRAVLDEMVAALAGESDPIELRYTTEVTLWRRV